MNVKLLALNESYETRTTPLVELITSKIHPVIFQCHEVVDGFVTIYDSNIPIGKLEITNLMTQKVNAVYGLAVAGNTATAIYQI